MRVAAPPRSGAARYPQVDVLISDLGTRLVRTYLAIWDDPETGASMVAMLSSATSTPDANRAFRDFMREYVLTAVSGALGGGPEFRLRAVLAATNLIGTVFCATSCGWARWQR